MTTNPRNSIYSKTGLIGGSTMLPTIKINKPYSSSSAVSSLSVGQKFESLCRTAYNGHVLRWLIEQLNADIVDPAVMEALDVGISETWFCPITDSMRINSFLKANKLTGKTHRPDWRSLRKFGDPAKIRQFINDNQIRRVVLLEDFVGSGTQMLSAIKFAADISSDIEILVLPLVYLSGW